jgi:hypothetical protein
MKADTFADWAKLPKPRALRVFYDPRRDGWLVQYMGRAGGAIATLDQIDGHPFWRPILLQTICAARHQARIQPEG